MLHCEEYYNFVTKLSDELMQDDKEMEDIISDEDSPFYYESIGVSAVFYAATGAYFENIRESLDVEETIFKEALIRNYHVDNPKGYNFIQFIPWCICQSVSSCSIQFRWAMEGAIYTLDSLFGIPNTLMYAPGIIPSISLEDGIGNIARMQTALKARFPEFQNIPVAFLSRHDYKYDPFFKRED